MTHQHFGLLVFRRRPVWDAASGQKLTTLKGHKGAVGKVAVSRDGSRILGVAFDQSVDLWDSGTGNHLVSLDTPGGAFLAVFTPDGEQILTVSRDGGIRLWPVDPLAAAIQRKSRDLTAEERERYGIVEPLK